jgi:hypothetical protein
MHPTDYLVHLPNVLMLVAYSVTDVLWLRWFAVAAALTNIPYCRRGQGADRGSTLRAGNRAAAAAKCLRESRQVAKADTARDGIQLECWIGWERLDESPED